MTLSEIADYCCLTIGITDTSTKTLAKDFAQLRWKMIWDSNRWTDTLVYTSQSVTAGTDIVTLDASIKMPMALRLDDLELAITDPVNVLQLDPKAWDESGEAVTYSILARDTNGYCRVKLMRIPTKTVTLLVLGKKVCTTLADGDEPTLPGVDQALCAYVLADLYKWQRQFSKAQLMNQEANSHLAQMLALEQQQQAYTARIIPMGGYADEWQMESEMI